MELPYFFQKKLGFMEKFGLIYRPWVSSALASLAGLGCLFFYFQSAPKIADYMKAERSFMKWEQSAGDEVAFREMQRALRKAPSLETKYEGAIIQKLIEIGKGADAFKMARPAFQRLKQEAPFHAIFGEISFSIEMGHHQEALEKSVGLKEQMNQEWVGKFPAETLAGGVVLYGHNLLRIACLQQELKNKPGEMAAWEELETFLEKNQRSGAAAILLRHFQEKGISLFNYIAERKRTL